MRSRRQPRRKPRAIVLALLGCLLSAPAPAQPQQKPSPLDQLRQAYEKQRLALVHDGAGFDEMAKLTAKFADDLEAFVKDKAQGMDRINGRLMLVDFRLSLGQRDRAIAALKAFPVDTAPPIALAAAAEFADHLGLERERDDMIDTAIARADRFEDRMTLAMHLLTRLQQITKGERILHQAFQAATDDETRAKVRWYEAAAQRDREDLPEDAYDKALKKLAETYPDTYFGGVARDRLVARDLSPGSDALMLELTDIDGKKLNMADLRGKVVLLDFWASWCGPCRDSAADLRKLYDRYHERGLEIISISFDDDVATARAAIAADGRIWPQICDGRGPMADTALRYNVEGPPRMILIGRDGKIVTMQLYPYDQAGLRETETILDKALSTGR